MRDRGGACSVVGCCYRYAEGRFRSAVGRHVGRLHLTASLIGQALAETRLLEATRFKHAVGCTTRTKCSVRRCVRQAVGSARTQAGRTDPMPPAPSLYLRVHCLLPEKEPGPRSVACWRIMAVTLPPFFLLPPVPRNATHLATTCASNGCRTSSNNKSRRGLALVVSFCGFFSAS